MALAGRYGESRHSAQPSPAACKVTTVVLFSFAGADGEVGAEGSAGNSQKLLRGRVDLDMHRAHTGHAGLAQRAKVRFNSRRGCSR